MATRRYRPQWLAGRAVVGEASRLLSGHGADGYGAFQAIPAWAPINLLAHASRRRLAGLRLTPMTSTPLTWRHAVGQLATQLVASTATDAELSAVQRAVLVPLELDLLAGAVPAPVSPAALRFVVVEALRTYDSRLGR